MKQYLSEGSWNSKTKKNVRDTLILYMSPHKQNSMGRNLCPKASAGCLMSCLYTAGRGAFSNVRSARERRTEAYLNDTDAFLESIAQQINARAKRVPQLAVRLNGTSDTKIVYSLLTKHYIAPNVVFYDYTKVTGRAGDMHLSSGHRYMVAFSRSEDNEEEAIEVLKRGGVVAVVFTELPTRWHGFTVIDGDRRDDLMLDIGNSVVLGLKAKGKARYDKSGFVVNPSVFKDTHKIKKHESTN